MSTKKKTETTNVVVAPKLPEGGKPAGEPLEAERQNFPEHNDEPSKKQGKTVEPEKSSGKPGFDLESQRETEIFDSKDVVFVREGNVPWLVAYPNHEAKTRFTEVKSRKSRFDRDKHYTVTEMDLKDGGKVLIEGVKVTVTPKGGQPSTHGPSLNVHGPTGANQ